MNAWADVYCTWRICMVSEAHIQSCVVLRCARKEQPTWYLYPKGLIRLDLDDLTFDGVSYDGMKAVMVSGAFQEHCSCRFRT